MRAEEDHGAMIARSIERPRFELVPTKELEKQAEHLPEGATVSIVCPPRHGIEVTLRASELLHDRGFQMVPHVPARLIADRRHLQTILRRLSDIGIVEIFVIGGDSKRAAGEFTSSLELLAAMRELDHDVERVGIAGYPEPHPIVDDATLEQALKAKEPFATYMVSQICFDPDEILAWIDSVRKRGIGLPIYVGILGVIEFKRLLQLSHKIGVGDSARFLRKQPGLIGRLLRPGRYSPDEMIAALAPYMEDPHYNIAGFHLNTFNQVQSTERWRMKILKPFKSTLEQDRS